MPFSRTAALVPFALALAGCGDLAERAPKPPRRGARDEAAAVTDMKSLTAERARAADGATAASPAAPTAAASSPNEMAAPAFENPAAVPAPDDPAMIVRTGNASVEVDSLDAAMALLRRLTARVGGFVGNASVQAGREQVRQATLEVKVPAPRFEELAAGLAPLGQVEFVNVSAEDVGEEFVDLTARAANARRLEARLIELLAARTGRLSDVLAVERELARVREEIERMEGRLRYLRSRSAVSSLSVNLHEPVPILARHPGPGPLGEAFRQAWRNFVGVVAALVAGLGAAAPVAGLAGAAIFLGRRYRRRAVRATLTP